MTVNPGAILKVRADPRGSARTRWHVLRATALSVGGALAIGGSVLPWLTLYAGLQRYSGTIGIYGWLVLCAGAISLGLGMLAFWHDIRAASQLAAAIGALLLGFTAWLLWGLHGMLRQPETLMLVPRSGPGLFVVFAGAVLIMCAGIAGVRGGRSNAH